MNAPFKAQPGQKIVTVHEAKTNLSRLLAEVEAGGEIIIARGKTEIAKIVPLHPAKKAKRVLGWLAHEKPDGSEGILDNGFFDPLPPEELARWTGEADDPLDPAR